jgi:uridine kinase
MLVVTSENDRPGSLGLIPFRDLAETIRTRPPSCGPVRLIAIDGYGGSGKTVFASRLSGSLGDVPIVHTDDFASWENPHNWWDRLEEDVLGPLERGDRVRYQAYDWTGHHLGDWLEIAASDVVIIEGVSSSRLAMSGRLAIAIWVDAPRAERMARGIARDGEAMRPQWELWMAAEDAHFAVDQTIDRAELMVDGSPSLLHDPEVEFVRLARPRGRG